VTHENHLEVCVRLLRGGELTEELLRQSFASAAGQQRPMQSLMYVSSFDTNIFSGLESISIIERGVRVEIPAERSQWPFHSVADAMRDGWRIIKFPDFSPDETRNCGLGCEFILEK